MPRFTLRDLFLMTTLIAVGMGCLVAAWKGEYKALSLRSSDPLVAIVLSYGGAMALGAGFATPFHRQTKGAFIGLLLGLIVGTLFWHA